MLLQGNQLDTDGSGVACWDLPTIRTGGSASLLCLVSSFQGAAFRHSKGFVKAPDLGCSLVAPANMFISQARVQARVVSQI